MMRYPSSILNFQILFNIRNIELKMSKHIRTCLSSVALKAEDTALIWMLTSAKNKKSLANAKCYRKEITSSRCLLFIYVGLHTDYVSSFTC